MAICTHLVVPYTGANNDLIFNLWRIFQAHFIMSTFQLRIGGFWSAGVWFYRHLCCTLNASHTQRLNLSFAFTTVFTYNFNGMWVLSAHRRTRNVKCHFMCIPHARAHFKSSKHQKYAIFICAQKVKVKTVYKFIISNIFSFFIRSLLGCHILYCL